MKGKCYALALARQEFASASIVLEITSGFAAINP